MYAQQPPVELLHPCEREAGTDRDKWNKMKGRKGINEHKRRWIKAVRHEPCQGRATSDGP